jgi:hypothetical protein
MAKSRKNKSQSENVSEAFRYKKMQTVNPMRDWFESFKIYQIKLIYFLSYTLQKH